jgi:two-component system phosphate regulon response regulator OmpR
MINKNKHHLLIIDDDERLRELLLKYLEENGFEITLAENAFAARKVLEVFQFDLIILDIMMPGETGLELTKSLRSENFETPILMLTAMGDVHDRIHGLELGVDEYLPKPFEPKELLLRINALLRRIDKNPAASQKKEIQIGAFHFDIERKSLRKGEEIIPLTTTESNMLKILVDHIGQEISREHLIDLIGGKTTPRTIDVQITRLRKKLEQDPKKPRFLQTIRNKGYILWGS